MDGDQSIRPQVTPAGELVDLAALDAIRPAQADPAVWLRNLAALEETQPEAAARLREAALPAGWQPSRGIDGVRTWRISNQEGDPSWLDGTAIPATRAGAMDLRSAGDRNIALATIGTGHEARSLLERASSLQAVFIFEENVAHIAAVFRTVSFDTALRARRLWLLPSFDDVTPLLQLVDRFRGLLPPGIILHLPNVPPERINALQETLRRAAEAAVASRTELLEAARSKLSARTAGAKTDETRIAFVSATGLAQGGAAASALSEALSQAGTGAEPLILDRPDRVHALWASERLADVAPRQVVFVDAWAQTLALPDNVRAAIWHLTADDKPLDPRAACHYAASPRLLERLGRKAESARPVRALFWAGLREGPAAESGALPDGAIVVHGDLPDDSAEACGVDQPSHKLLWQTLQGTVAARWDSRDILFPEALLAAVEREAGVSLRDAATRSRMLHQIESRLAPAQVARKLARVVSEIGLPCVAFGEGWRRWSETRITIDPSPPWQLPRGWRPLAALLPVCADPFLPAMQAATLGWPLLVHAPGGESPDAAFGGVLRSNQDFLTFRSTRDLAALLRAILQNPADARARAMRAAERLQRDHGWDARARALLSEYGP